MDRAARLAKASRSARRADLMPYRNTAFRAAEAAGSGSNSPNTFVWTRCSRAVAG